MRRKEIEELRSQSRPDMEKLIMMIINDGRKRDGGAMHATERN